MTSPSPQYLAGMQRLLRAVQELSMARQLSEVQAIVRVAAREMTACDGATFILRDGTLCHYADEDALAPLWKGRRFPMEACISGWAMLNREAVSIEDIYQDPRIPHDAYRPTFVKSLTMVPIRQLDPIGAIGNYWAAPHQASAEEVALLQSLADATSVALENVRIQDLLLAREQDHQRLQQEIEAETRDLQDLAQQVASRIRELSSGSGLH
ncbi:MAG TPA: GAF domain-containing protein [Nevskiaceae bacterium]|nr:GAF domain-containing protein [Nevskiaceae bacterium]